MLDAWAQNQLTNPWRTAAYGFITGFGMGARNAAWGVLMGPCGSVLTSISAPGLLITQIFSDATGLLEAWQVYKDTGDRRLLTVRSFCAGVHFILTLTQLRIIMNGRACFTAGTPLLTQRGWVPIEEITTDDYVWSRPEHDPSAACEWKRVEELFTRYAQVQNLHVGGKVIGTTSEHPFWVVGQGWKKAWELQKGDILIGHDGRETPVEEIFDTQVFQPVYNLRVADFHTYFVGSDEWGFSVWAHNAGEGYGGRAKRDAPKAAVPSQVLADTQTALKNINAGTKPSWGGKWGVPHKNLEGNLPKLDAAGKPIAYTEYYLPKNPGDTTKWGANRLVVGSDGSVYVTTTHYGQAGNPPFVYVGTK